MVSIDIQEHKYSLLMYGFRCESFAKFISEQSIFMWVYLLAIFVLLSSINQNQAHSSWNDLQHD